MSTEIFQFWPLGAEKMDIEVGNPMSKRMVKSTQAQFVLDILRSETPLFYTWVSIPLPQKKIIDDKKCFKHNKEIFIWKTRVFQFQLCQKKTVTEKVWFGHAFRCRVTNFKPHFLSPQKLKLKNFSAHQQEDFLRISKLTLLLFLVPILKELWPFQTWGHFFWDTL